MAVAGLANLAPLHCPELDAEEAIVTRLRDTLEQYGLKVFDEPISFLGELRAPRPYEAVLVAHDTTDAEPPVGIATFEQNTTTTWLISVAVYRSRAKREIKLLKQAIVGLLLGWRPAPGYQGLFLKSDKFGGIDLDEFLALDLLFQSASTIAATPVETSDLLLRAIEFRPTADGNSLPYHALDPQL